MRREWSMSAPALRFKVESVAVWAPTLPGGMIARAAIRGEAGPVDPPAKRPAPEILAAAERRRAPDSVALALQVAADAARDAGRDPALLPAIFTSCHGDLAVNDYMCTTLATEPRAISPTRFHNSVHNAAAGYWTIGTGCRAASSAVTAFDASFAAGLLEAASQCVADERAVLLVAFDIAAVGALASVTKSDGLFAAAWVIAPPADRPQAPGRSFSASLVPGPTAAPPLRSAAARALAGNAMAGALPFLEALALNVKQSLDLPLSRSLALRLAAP
jgi:hypothetical protein